METNIERFDATYKKREWFNVMIYFKKSVDLCKLAKENPNVEYDFESNPCSCDRYGKEHVAFIKTQFGTVKIWEKAAQLPFMKVADKHKAVYLQGYIDALVSSNEKRSFVDWFKEDTKRFLEEFK